MPFGLHVTISAQTGTCSLANFTMTGDAILAQWQGFDNNAKSWTLTCLTGTSCADFILSSVAYGVSVHPDAGCSCDPFQLVFTGVVLSSIAPPCLGTVTITITL